MSDKPIHEKSEKTETGVGKAPDDRKWAGEFTGDSQTLFQAITEQSGEGISLADTDGKYVFVNRAFCEMTGYGEAELLSMNVFDLTAPEAILELFPKVVKKQTGTREAVLVKKEGERFLAEIKGYPIEFKNRSLALGIVRDVTEQHRSQVALKESETKFTKEELVGGSSTALGIYSGLDRDVFRASEKNNYPILLVFRSGYCVA